MPIRTLNMPSPTGALVVGALFPLLALFIGCTSDDEQDVDTTMECESTHPDDPECEICRGTIEDYCPASDPDFCYLSYEACEAPNNGDMLLAEMEGCGYYKRAVQTRSGLYSVAIVNSEVMETIDGRWARGSLVYRAFKSMGTCETGWEAGEEPACDEWTEVCESFGAGGARW